jgi:hypothetical protein
MALAGAALLAATVPVRAHHAFSAEFDANAPLTLRGPITRLEWTNPHTFLSVAVTTPLGKTEIWRVEGGSPSTLIERDITREMLAIGTVVVIAGFQAKDRSALAWGRDITFPDGRTFYIGSPKNRPPPGAAPAGRLGSTLTYIVIVPGVILAAGLFILWRRKRGRDKPSKEWLSQPPP